MSTIIHASETYHLQIRNAHIKTVVHVCVPDQANVRYVKCSKITLNWQKSHIGIYI
jgi:hypothetical protein